MYNNAFPVKFIIFLLFQERRSEREIEKLFQILERVTEINGTQIERVKLASDIHLPNLNANLEVSVSMCNKILEKEETYRSVSCILYFNKFILTIKCILNSSLLSGYNSSSKKGDSKIGMGKLH